VDLKVLVLNINNYPFGHYDYSRKGERIVAQGLQSGFLSLSEERGFLFATKYLLDKTYILLFYTNFISASFQIIDKSYLW